MKTPEGIHQDYVDGKLTFWEGVDAMARIKDEEQLSASMWKSFRRDSFFVFLVAMAILISSTFATCNANASPATDAIKACAPYRDLIADAAKAASVPASLLTALVFAESTCRADAVNAKTNAIGLTQLLPTGAGAGYTLAELLDPLTNATVGAKYLAKWKARCGSWRGAVEVYNGRQTCKIRSKQGAKIVEMWRAIEMRERPRA